MFADIAQPPLLPPLGRFAIAMLILFATPPLCRRVRLPAVVGLMAAGVLVGPYGLELAPRHGEVAEFFAEIGKLPLTAGLLVGLWAGYPWVGALLIGSLLASHTLIAYPIVHSGSFPGVGRGVCDCTN